MVISSSATTGSKTWNSQIYGLHLRQLFGGSGHHS
jgi:hypothetical protein